MLSKSSENRIFYLDALRFFACLSVIMIHASTYFISAPITSGDFLTSHIFNTLSRCGVPMFVMLSGANLLSEDRTVTVKDTLRRALRLVIFFAVWSALYAVAGCVESGSFGLSQLITRFISGHSHLWFVYMLLGLYLVLPAIRLLCKNDNRKVVEYLLITAIFIVFVLSTLSSVLYEFYPRLDFLRTVPYNLSFSMPGAYLVYFILGWYLKNYDIKHKKTLYILGILSVFVTFFGTLLLSRKAGFFYSLYIDSGLNILFFVTAVFVFFKSHITCRGGFISSSVSFVSRCSLGIYAMHPAFCLATYKLVYTLPAACAVPCIFAAGFALSLALSALARKIPFVRNIV